MAKDASRRRDDAAGKAGHARREVGRMGSHANTKHRDAAAVRRQRRLQTDARLLRAREEIERHEEALRALEAQKNAEHREQVREYVERTTREQGVPFHVEDPETIAKVTALWVPERRKETEVVDTQTKKTPSRETKPAPISWTVADAHGLLAQGYHVERVVKLTGIPVTALKSLVGADGYKKGL